jgi:SAM-dependent methyltransferase
MNLNALRAIPTGELVHLLFFDLLVGGTLLGLVLGTALGTLAARMATRRASPEFRLSRDEMAHLGTRLPALPFPLRQYARSKIHFDPVYAFVASLLTGVRETLDLGAGLGIMAAMLVHRDPGRRVVAVEWDPRKVAWARRFLSGLPQVDVICADARTFPAAPVESILLLDVLHYSEPFAQDVWLGRCASALKQGGMLIIREHDASSKWAWAGGFERLAVKLGCNRGEGFRPRRAIDLVQRLESLGLDVETIDNSGGFAGLALLVARKSFVAERAQAARPCAD